MGVDLRNHLFAPGLSPGWIACARPRTTPSPDQVRTMAAALGVNLVAVTPSKPKTHPATRFGIANAFNTGFVLARGAFVTILQVSNGVCKVILQKLIPPQIRQLILHDYRYEE